MSSFSYFCNNNFGKYVFSYTGLDYEDLCRWNDYRIHSNNSSSFNKKIEILYYLKPILAANKTERILAGFVVASSIAVAIVYASNTSIKFRI